MGRGVSFLSRSSTPRSRACSTRCRARCSKAVKIIQRRYQIATEILFENPPFRNNAGTPGGASRCPSPSALSLSLGARGTPGGATFGRSSARKLCTSGSIGAGSGSHAARAIPAPQRLPVFGAHDHPMISPAPVDHRRRSARRGAIRSRDGVGFPPAWYARDRSGRRSRIART